jgi:hypothetical protein
VIGGALLAPYHRRMVSPLRIAAVLFALATAVLPAFPLMAGEGKPPIVVELFTSQGCSSCPPADAFLGELARRPEIIALSFHVDYWDYIGWKDPFAQHGFTKRQRGYSHLLGQRYVYTPQMIVDGKYQEVGSDRRAIDRLIERARKERAAGPMPVIEVTGEGLTRTARVSGPAPAQPAQVFFLAIDRKHETDVAKGENGGKRLPNYNVVRVMRQIGTFDGKSVELPIDLTSVAGKSDGGVVLMQSANMGPVLAAITFNVPSN